MSAFSRKSDSSIYMLPSTPQALMESVGPNGSTGPEAVAAAEKNAALLTARASDGDPSAIPSICRVSAALQYPAGICLYVTACIMKNQVLIEIMDYNYCSVCRVGRFGS